MWKRPHALSLDKSRFNSESNENITFAFAFLGVGLHTTGNPRISPCVLGTFLKTIHTAAFVGSGWAWGGTDGLYWGIRWSHPSRKQKSGPQDFGVERWGCKKITGGRDTGTGTPLPCRTQWLSMASCQSLSGRRGTGQQRTIPSVSLLPDEDYKPVLRLF